MTNDDLVLGYILGYVVGSSLLISLLWAAFLQSATRRLYQFSISYGKAYAYCVLGLLAANATAFYLEFLMSVPDLLSSVWYYIIVVASVLVYSTITGIMIRHPYTGAIGLKRALVLLGIKFVGSLIIIAILSLILIFFRIMTMFFSQ